VISEDTTSLIRLVVEGGNSPATIYGTPRQPMPPFAARLTDAQIAQVRTYVQQRRTPDHDERRLLSMSELESRFIAE
jgi:mono/diheme cytochrome c family protein